MTRHDDDNRPGAGGAVGAGAVVKASPDGLLVNLVDKLSRAVNQGLTRADVRQRSDRVGGEVGGGTPQEFVGFVKGETSKAAKLMKAGLLHTR